MSKALPDGWSLVPLSEIANHALGKMLDRRKHTKGVQLPYLRNINVRWGSFDLTEVLSMFFRESEIERYSVRPGDLLVCEGGEPGRCAIWREHFDGMMFQKALHRVRPHDGVLPELIALQLEAEAASGRLTKLFTGTTIKHLTGRSLARLNVKVPPTSEQQRIIAKLDALRARSQRARAALEAVPPLLDKLRRSVLAAAFRGDLTAAWRAQNPDVEPASVLLERILAERRRRWEEAELAKMAAKGTVPKNDKWKARYQEPVGPDVEGLPALPSSWCWASVDQIGWVQGGIQKGKKRPGNVVLREVPYLRVANVQRGFLDLTEVPEIAATEAEIEKLRLVPGDVLFNEGGDLDKLGRGWVWSGELDTCIHQNHVFRLRLAKGVLPKLVSWYGNTAGKYYFLKVGKQTTNLASLNSTMLRSLPIPIASQDEQGVLQLQVERLLDASNPIEMRIAERLKDVDLLETTSLKSAFQGKLVPQDPNDEPASVLLERIRKEREAAAPKKRAGRRKSVASR